MPRLGDIYSSVIRLGTAFGSIILVGFMRTADAPTAIRNMAVSLLAVEALLIWKPIRTRILRNMGWVSAPFSAR